MLLVCYMEEDAQVQSGPTLFYLSPLGLETFCPQGPEWELVCYFRKLFKEETQTLNINTFLLRGLYQPCPTCFAVVYD